MRLLIYAIAVFIGYLIYKSVRESLSRPAQMHRRKQDEAITAELVEDPVCHTYCPKNNSLVARVEEGTYYFCSEECRQKFLDMRKGGPA